MTLYNCATIDDRMWGRVQGPLTKEQQTDLENYYRVMGELTMREESIVFELVERGTNLYKEKLISYPLTVKTGDAICINERMWVFFKDETFNSADELPAWLKEKP